MFSAGLTESALREYLLSLPPLELRGTVSSCQVTPESVPPIYGQSVPPVVPRRQLLLCILQR
jgi:hypothetical protein